MSYFTEHRLWWPSTPISESCITAAFCDLNVLLAPSRLERVLERGNRMRQNGFFKFLCVMMAANERGWDHQRVTSLSQTIVRYNELAKTLLILLMTMPKRFITRPHSGPIPMSVRRQDDGNAVDTDLRVCHRHYHVSVTQRKVSCYAYCQQYMIHIWYSPQIRLQRLFTMQLRLGPWARGQHDPVLIQGCTSSWLSFVLWLLSIS